jgi:23S rRNA (guanosine2251-2'-O)-methyltransferase
MALIKQHKNIEVEELPEFESLEDAERFYENQVDIDKIGYTVDQIAKFENGPELLVEKLLEDEITHEVSSRIASTLSKIDAERAPVEDVMNLLKLRDAFIRNLGISILRDYGDAIKYYIVKFLIGNDRDLRIFAINVLGDVSFAQSRDMLVELLESEKDINVAMTAVDYMAEIGEPEDIELLESIKDRFENDPYVTFGVAIDVIIDSYKSAKIIYDDFQENFKFLALDGVNNPQNLGMIIRAVAASKVDAIILGESCTKISPLVMKSSAGTLFKLPIYHTKNLANTLKGFSNTKIYSLSSHALLDIKDIKKYHKEIFVLGNESSGVSELVESTCNESIKIDMNRGVESLNVAITAAIISFL